MTSDKPIVGMDLGTTYSLCAVLQNGEPVVLPNAIGELLTPSAVSLDDDGRLLVGAAARARALTHPDRTALRFKRDMGTDRSIKIGSRSFTPPQLSAMVLAELKRDAEKALGTTIEEAVVTVPAYFGDAQRTATKQAGELAGLRVERIINEPTAAAMAYGLHARDRDLRAIVLDLGGGTFDVTVLEIVEGVIEVQGSAGDARLGGEDFADALADLLAADLSRSYGVASGGDALLQARIREAAERAKKELSQADTVRVPFVELKTQSGVRDVELELTRERAYAAWQPLLQRIRAPIARALRDASALASAFDEVLVVGGATRMPCFIELVAGTFGRMPSRELPADEAVVMGAAIQGALKQRDVAVQDLVVTDVAPFSLGIATAAQYGTRQVDGLFTPIIERGTVIPASRSETFRTLVDNQTKINVEVYQGEHSLCRENTKLAEYSVTNLPKAPAGEQSIEVRFTYDLNGILEVDTTVVGTDRTHSHVVAQRTGAMTQKQIEQAREAMKLLKFHPRDALPNRTALARADALFAQLSGEGRHVLAAAIAEMHGALETQDNRRIDAARERLVQMTSSLSRR